MLLNDRKLLLMLDTAEETVDRRLLMAEDTVDLRLDMLLEVLLLMLFQPDMMLDLKLLTAEVVVLFMEFHVLLKFDLTAFHTLVVDDRILFHPEVILVFNELTADVVVLLMEFQLLVKLDRTAFHTLVVVLLMLFHPEDMLDFNAFTADTAVLLMAFQLLLKLLLTALHVLAVVFWTLPQPEEMLDFMELTAAFTEADPLCIAWLIPVQLWLTAFSTPVIALVIAVESVVDRLFAAVSTRPTLLLMPSASPCMKSGIQLSKSASGPSSGTEKCRKERILSATLVTAEATLLMQDLIPFTIPLMISAPQENACPASPLMKDTA